MPRCAVCAKAGEFSFLAYAAMTHAASLKRTFELSSPRKQMLIEWHRFRHSSCSCMRSLWYMWPQSQTTIPAQIMKSCLHEVPCSRWTGHTGTGGSREHSLPERTLCRNKQAECTAGHGARRR
jgi:hypothetical protein